MTDRDTLQMLRDGRAERLRTGLVDERADVVLALYEAGISGWGPGVSTDTLKAWLANPSLAPGFQPRAAGVDEPLAVARHRRGGDPASNQFGTFEVHQASAKQVAFVKRLLAERDLTGIKVPDQVETISKTAASALIDRLMGRPMRATSVGTTAGAVRLASDKQMAFIRKLMTERDYYSLLPADRAKWDAVAAGKVPTAKGASEFIDMLTSTAFAPRSEQPAADELESGMYRSAVTGEVLKVYRAVHGSGRMCAKLLVVPEGYADWTKEQREAHGRLQFDYLGLATRFVKDHRRMTLDDAKEFGAIYGVCCQCGATLTAEESIELGIGPICRGKI